MVENQVQQIRNWPESLSSPSKKNPGLSVRDLAKRYGTLQKTVRNVKSRFGYHCYRAVKAPNRGDKQNLVAKSRARLLYTEFLTKFRGCILMDDETVSNWTLNRFLAKNFIQQRSAVMSQINSSSFNKTNMQRNY